MTTAFQALGAIAASGERAYAGSSLARSHRRVTSRVRRVRAVRATADAAAGAGVLAGGIWGVASLMGHGDAGTAVPGLGTPVPSASSVNSPTPSVSPAPSLGQASDDRPVTVINGQTVDQAAKHLADAYGVDQAVALAAIADAVSAQVPEATTPEGWIADGTYNTGVYPTIVDAADALVSARVDQLEALGVPRAQWQDTLTVASLAAAEAPLVEDRAATARAILNRLAAGLPLELDSTIRYTLGADASPFVTDAERAVDGPYNTFLREGLPAGAVCVPSAGDLDAAVHPADGPWMSFVVVNLMSGEMVFATTDAERAAAQAQRDAWIEANTGS